MIKERQISLWLGFHPHEGACDLELPDDMQGKSISELIGIILKYLEKDAQHHIGLQYSNNLIDTVKEDMVVANLNKETTVRIWDEGSILAF